jgi:hypothetical protein
MVERMRKTLVNGFKWSTCAWGEWLNGVISLAAAEW